MEENSKKEWLRGLKFVLFSISAGVIQVASFTVINLLISSNQEYGVAYFISLLLSVLWNFTFNRKFTFKSAVNVPKAMALVLAFYAVFTPLSTIGGDALVSIGWNGTLVLIMTMVINFITEYVYDALVVFRDKKSDSEQEERKDLDTNI